MATTTPSTLLDKKIASNGAAPSKGTALDRLLANGRRGEVVDIPGLGTVRLELLGATAAQEVEAAVLKAMHGRDVAFGAITAGAFEIERAVRTLAESAIDPADRTPLGDAAKWGQVDEATIAAAWQAYDDVRTRLDPMSLPLSVDDTVAISSAVKKKDALQLRTYGAVKLSAWLASTAGQLAISPPPSSSSSESPSGS